MRQPENAVLRAVLSLSNDEKTAIDIVAQLVKRGAAKKLVDEEEQRSVTPCRVPSPVRQGEEGSHEQAGEERHVLVAGHKYRRLLVGVSRAPRRLADQAAGLCGRGGTRCSDGAR